MFFIGFFGVIGTCVRPYPNPPQIQVSLVRWAPRAHDASQVSESRCCNNREHVQYCHGGLALHGFLLSFIWGDSNKAGLICTVMDGPCRVLTSALPEAAQLRADGISSFCYIENVHNHPNGSQGPTALHVNSFLVLIQCQSWVGIHRPKGTSFKKCTFLDKLLLQLFIES